MRVMHIIDSLAIGGAERMLVTLANRSLADGLEVSVCATRAGGPLASELDARVPLRVLPRRRRVDPDSFAALERFASDRRIEIFHVHGRSSFSFLAVARTVGGVTAPIVFHDHYGAIERDPSVPAWMRCWGAAMVGQYVGVSNGLCKWAERARVPRCRIRAIENGIEMNRYRCHRPFGMPPGDQPVRRKLIGLVVGNIRPDKGIEVLLRAMAGISRHRQPQIWICGGCQDAAYESRCRGLIRALGLRGCIRFLGERDDIGRFVANADFGVIPSISESGPLVLAELLSAGLPVVATEAGSLARRARSLGVRDFVPPGDAAALAAALERLISLTPAQRVARGEHGRALAARHFDIAAAMPRWYKVYEDALWNRRS
jgi:glycosyltransferase involved in cell wall biosynthesis